LTENTIETFTKPHARTFILTSLTSMITLEGKPKMEMNRKTKASLALLLTFSIALTLFASVLSDPGLGEFRWLGDTNLALCGQPEDNSQWDILISWGISSCINMRSGTPEDDVPYLLSQGLTYYHLPTTDWNISPEETHAGVQWINEQLADGRKVLIHCNHGTSRAPTMAAMWYIHEGHTAQEALAWIQSYPPSYPTDMETQAMLDYYDWLCSEDPDPPENTDIPEFPSWIILPLFVIATVVVIIYRNRLRRKVS